MHAFTICHNLMTWHEATETKLCLLSWWNDTGHTTDIWGSAGGAHRRSEESSISTKQVCLGRRSTLCGLTFTALQNISEMQSVFIRVGGQLVCRGEQMVLSALLPTVNNSLHPGPRRAETHLKDMAVLWEKQKRTVTTERNFFSKERCRN